MFKNDDRVMILTDIYCCIQHEDIPMGSTGIVRYIHGNNVFVRLDTSPHGSLFNGFIINSSKLVRI